MLQTGNPYHPPTSANWIAQLIHYSIRVILASPTMWLNGSIINAAQFLLKNQAADRFVGFQDVSTLKEGFKHVEKEQPFLQILLINGNHWVTTTNAGCTKGEVKVFDSAHNNLTTDTKKQICSMLWLQEDSVKFELVDMQTQRGSGSCGLFAIAVAVELVAGRDPTTCEWEESSMRNHLYMCFRQNRLTSFPLKRCVHSCCKCQMPADTGTW